MIAAIVLAAAAAVPPLTLPPDFVAEPPKAAGVVSFWRRPLAKNQYYPTNVNFSFMPAGPPTYDATVVKFRTMLGGCPSGPFGDAMKADQLCGFVIDRDGTCGGLTAHTFVSISVLGRNERIATTQIFVRYGTGYAYFRYQRPQAQFAVLPDGSEKPDDVLDALHAWCAQLPVLSS